jgi:hypothetical protein
MRLTTIQGGTMRRSGAFGVAAAALAAATAVAITSADGSTTGATIRLYEHDTTQVSVDAGAAGESAGDQFVFAGDTFKTKGGPKVGRAAGTCTTMSTGSGGEVICVVNFAVPAGQIATQGLLAAAELFGGKTLSFPITGGTGRYRRARGEATVQIPQDVPNLADANFVLRPR